MKKKMKSKIIAVVMSLAVAFTMMPVMGAPAYADDPAPAAPGIALGPDVLGAGSNTSGAATVHMAGTKWHVIGYKKAGVASNEDTMTLIAAKYLKDDVQFNPESNESNSYKDSKLHNEVMELTHKEKGIFSDGEKSAIVKRDLPRENVTDALLWPLSSEDAFAMSLDLRASTNNWWLRSPGTTEGYAACVAMDGGVLLGGNKVTNGYGVRPAFHCDLKSVSFTSAAKGGKSGDVGAGSLAQVETNATGEWKLTVKDDVHAGFKVDEAYSCDGKNLYIKYSGAVPGDNEYISAIIKDKNDVIKYYGKLAVVSDSGKATVTFDGKMSEGDTLCIFNEQCNGNYETDFSSPLWETEILYILHPFQPATCTEPETCENCGIKRGTPTGHKYGAWTKLNTTQHQRVCEHDKSHVVKENHKWDAGKVTKKATEKQAGVKTYTCTVCKATKTETIPKLKPQPKPQPTVDKAAAKTSLNAGVIARSSGSKVTASWGAVKGASSYVIYANYCDQKKLKKIKTVSGKTTSFDITKLNGKKFDPKKNLKFYVVAYKTVKGKKVKLAKSIMAHAPGSKNTKRTNVTGVKVKKASFTLKKGKTAKIKAKLVLQKKNKKPLKHCAKFRYASSNKKVAKVSKKGKITAVGKGKCNVYVYAVSGVSKKIKVTVK